MVIVGGGFVGLSLAVVLGQAGLSTIIIDREAPANATAESFDGRASAIALASQRLLVAGGIWPHVRDPEMIREIRVSDADSLLFLHYDHRELGNDPFGYMVENRFLRLALLSRLAEMPTARLVAPSQIQDIRRDAGRARLMLSDGRMVAGQLLVAADGRRSQLAAHAGIRVFAWDYRQAGIVCTVHHERPHHGIAQERFLPAGPFAILPLTGNRSSLVWTERADLVPALLALPEPDFLAELSLRFGSHLGALELAGPRWSYPLSLHLAERYTDHRLVLTGDAAHGIHPIAGQGLNLGLRDVAALAEVLVEANRLGLDLGQRDVLERYARWRRADNLMLAGVTDILNRLFSNDLAPLRVARDVGLAMINRLPPLKRIFMRHAMGSVGTLPRLLRGLPL